MADSTADKSYNKRNSFRKDAWISAEFRAVEKQSVLGRHPPVLYRLQRLHDQGQVSRHERGALGARKAKQDAIGAPTATKAHDIERASRDGETVKADDDACDEGPGPPMRLDATHSQRDRGRRQAWGRARDQTSPDHRQR